MFYSSNSANTFSSLTGFFSYDLAVLLVTTVALVAALEDSEVWTNLTLCWSSCSDNFTSDFCSTFLVTSAALIAFLGCSFLVTTGLTVSIFLADSVFLADSALLADSIILADSIFLASYSFWIDLAASIFLSINSFSFFSASISFSFFWSSYIFNSEFNKDSNFISGFLVGSTALTTTYFVCTLVLTSVFYLVSFAN